MTRYFEHYWERSITSRLFVPLFFNFLEINMSLKKKRIGAGKSQPEHYEVDVESCHENIQDVRFSRIAENAYYKAEARGFEPGHELEDWLAAEGEIRWY